MLSRIIGLAALLLAAGLLAAGCGDDDEETTASVATTTPAGATGATGAVTGPLSHEEFVAEADAICKAGDKQIDAAADETFSGGQPSAEEEEQFVTGTVIPNIQKQLDGIAALTPPEGEEDQVQAILDAAQQALDDVEQDPSLIGPGSSGNPFAEANRLAQDYGLTECGDG